MSREFDTPAWRELRDQKMMDWMAGNQDALETALWLSHISERWDDLIDRDKPMGDAEINDMMVAMLVRLQTNPFYLRYHAVISPITWVAVNAWMDANTLEKWEGDRWRQMSFFIRNYQYEVATVCAMCAGGWDHLRRISLDMRTFFAHETYDEWEKRA